MTELAVAYPDRYPSARLLARVADLRRRLDQALDSRLDPGDHRTVCLFHELGLLRQEALVTDNPLLSGKKLLFVKRFTYDSDHYYDEFNAGIRRFGGGFAVLSLADGTVRDVAPTLAAAFSRSLRPVLRRPAHPLQLQAGQTRRVIAFTRSALTAPVSAQLTLPARGRRPAHRHLCHLFSAGTGKASRPLRPLDRRHAPLLSAGRPDRLHLDPQRARRVVRRARFLTVTNLHRINAGRHRAGTAVAGRPERVLPDGDERWPHPL